MKHKTQKLHVILKTTSALIAKKMAVKVIHSNSLN